MMKKLAVVLALAPSLALAAPQATPTPRPTDQAAAQGDATAMRERMEKRMRLARTLGLAEALDLDEAGAMRARDLMTRYDEKRAPLRKAMGDDVHTLRDAARGDKAAAGKVDASLQHLRETRAQLQKLDTEMLSQLTQGMSPEKKARTALFLSRFRYRTAGLMMGGGMGPCGGGMGGGMGGMGCPKGAGMGMGMGHGGRGHHGPGFGPGPMGLHDGAMRGAAPSDRLAMMGGQGEADDLGAPLGDMDGPDLAEGE